IQPSATRPFIFSQRYVCSCGSPCVKLQRFNPANAAGTHDEPGKPTHGEIFMPAGDGTRSAEAYSRASWTAQLVQGLAATKFQFDLEQGPHDGQKMSAVYRRDDVRFFNALGCGP